jgi:uncharacterized protein YegP (UPF0339 family)
MKFEIYRALKGWRWRLIGRNSKIVASGEPYSTKAACIRAVKRMQQDVPMAEIKILPKAKL